MYSRTPQLTIWRMRISRWVPTVANTHSEYVVLIDFPPQQWLYDRNSMLRYTYIACLLYFSCRSAAHMYLDVQVKQTAYIIVYTYIPCILIIIKVFSPTDARLNSLKTNICIKIGINPLNPELNPICYLLALLAHHFLHVSRIMVKSLTLWLLMSYIYMERIFLMFLDHTQRRTTVGRTPLDE